MQKLWNKKNDRFFKLNDILFLKEYNPIEKKYTGCTAKCKVIYILNQEDFPEGIQDGYCVMGIKFLGYADFNEPIEGWISNVYFLENIDFK